MRPLLQWPDFSQTFILTTDASGFAIGDVENWRSKLAEYDFDVVYREGKINVNTDALSRNPIDYYKEESKDLQVADSDTFMTSNEKMITKKMFTRKKQEKSRNKVKPLKWRNLNRVIAPDNVDHFRKTSEAKILNINTKIAEICQDFLTGESFSDLKKYFKMYQFIDKSSFKTYFHNNLFIKPNTCEKYENWPSTAITTRGKKKK